MARMSLPRLDMRLASLFLAWTLSGVAIAAAGQTRAVPHVLADPAVFAFTDFVEYRAGLPLSNTAIATGVDLLVSALEAVVIAQRLNEDLLDRAHALRRDVRRVYHDPATAERISKHQELFKDLGQLMAGVNDQLQGEHRIPRARIDAVQRSADGIERDAPLPEQPDAVERFFRHAAEALRVARP